MLRRADTCHDNLTSGAPLPRADKKTGTLSHRLRSVRGAEAASFWMLTPCIRRRPCRRTDFSPDAARFRPPPCHRGPPILNIDRRSPPSSHLRRVPGAPPSAESPARSPRQGGAPPSVAPSHCPQLDAAPSPAPARLPCRLRSRGCLLRPAHVLCSACFFRRTPPRADKKSAAPASENSDPERRSLLTVTLR